MDKIAFLLSIVPQPKILGIAEQNGDTISPDLLASVVQGRRKMSPNTRQILERVCDKIRRDLADSDVQSFAF